MKRILLTALMAAAALIQAYSQWLTIGECARLAEANYPAVAEYGILEQTERLNLAKAAKAWLPGGSVSGRLSWQNDVAALPDILSDLLASRGVDYPGLGKTQYRIGADINQQIWDGGVTRAEKRAITSAAEAERRRADLRMYDLKGRVEDIYFAILMLDEQVRRADTSIALLDSTLSQVRVMEANGTAMRSDRDQIEASALGARQQRARLLATRDSHRRVLEIFIGEPIGDRMLVVPGEGDMTAGRYDHPQLRLFESRIESLRAMEGKTGARSMPTVGAFLTGYFGYPGYDMFENMRSRDPSFNFMAGIKVSWNFSSLYTRRDDLAKLRCEQERIDTERRTFLFNNRVAEREALGQITALRDVTRDDARIVELRRSVLDAARSRLRNGVIDTTALLSKITDLELAENDLALHKLQLIRAQYNLNHITNL